MEEGRRVDIHRYPGTESIMALPCVIFHFFFSSSSFFFFFFFFFFLFSGRNMHCSSSPEVELTEDEELELGQLEVKHMFIGELVEEGEELLALTRECRAADESVVKQVLYLFGRGAGELIRHLGGDREAAKQYIFQDQMKRKEIAMEKENAREENAVREKEREIMRESEAELLSFLEISFQDVQGTLQVERERERIS